MCTLAESLKGTIYCDVEKEPDPLGGVEVEHRTRARAGSPKTDNATHLIKFLLFSNNMPFILLGL